jgi:manganese/zinc/iron transport system permease protein
MDLYALKIEKAHPFTDRERSMNPYWGKDFFQCLLLFCTRLFDWMAGKGGELASDEIQIFVLMGVAVASALVGTFLVLKRMTMLANSLSHTILLGIVLAYLLMVKMATGDVLLIDLKVLLFGAFLSGLLTTFLTQILTHFMKVQEDASIGFVFSTLFALGIVLVTLYTRNTHIGIEAIMGNVDALHPHDLKLILSVCLFNLIPLILFFKEFKLIAFDATFAKVSGFSSALFNYLLMVQVAATAIGAFRAVGVLLFLAFLVGPVATARLLTHRLPKLIFFAALLGMFASLIGVALSRHFLSVYHLPLSTAGLVVVLIAIFYLLAFFGKKLWNINYKRATI